MQSTWLWIVGAFVALEVSADGETPTYADVAPIFNGRCVVCHSGDDAPLGLRLDDFAAIQKGSRNGPVVVAGKPAESELKKRIRGESTPRMPLDGPPYLDDAQIARLEAWIAGGLLPAPEPTAKRDPVAPPKAEAVPVVRPRPKPGEAVAFADVEPIFKKRCVKCHKDGGIRGPAPEGLRLDTWSNIVAKSERARVVPGSPLASELSRRIRGLSKPRMPLDGPPYLSDDDIRLISDWIAQGAPNLEGKKAPTLAGAEVRLHGTLTARFELDGLRLAVGPGTRVDKSPSVGDYVEVRGVVEADGTIRVTRLRRR